MDLLAEGVLAPDDYRDKRESLKNRQYDLVSLIHAYDEADSGFGGTMEKLMKVAMGAHKAFQEFEPGRPKRVAQFCIFEVKPQRHNPMSYLQFSIWNVQEYRRLFRMARREGFEPTTPRFVV